MKTPFLFVLVASAVSLACGGTTFSGTNGGGGDGGKDDGGSGSGSSGGSGSSSGGPTSSPCPAAAPTSGATCDAAQAGVSCEFGDDPNLSCDSVFTCTGGAWKATVPTASGCPTPKASGACPATYAAAQKAGVCLDHGLECGYPQGRCECAMSTGGPPSVGVNAYSWLCDAPTASVCPVPRPNLGTACSSANAFCDYGACSIPDGVALLCTDGTWQTTSEACAALSR